MGDDCCNPDSMGRVVKLLQDRLPGVFVHSIQVGKDREQDHKAGFFGEINDQVDYVCKQLFDIPELTNGFNALGFSQGGLFLRAYVQRCNQPAVHRLFTFGSPHAGVSDIPNCMNPGDLTCAWMRAMVRSGAYTNYVQRRVVQAQYYKDPKNMKGYLSKNIFLPDINNELETKNGTYRNNLAQLNTLVLIRFADDTMVKPAETAWFWMYNEEGELIPLEQQDLYLEDWLGLRKLGGRVKYLVSPGRHMAISDEFLDKEIITPYLATDIVASTSEPREPRIVLQVPEQ